MYSSEQLFQGAELPFAVLISFLCGLSWMSLMSWIVLVWMGLGSSAACYLYIYYMCTLAVKLVD